MKILCQISLPFIPKINPNFPQIIHTPFQWLTLFRLLYFIVLPHLHPFPILHTATHISPHSSTSTASNKANN
ncbi:hypothetical protein L1987_62049 [Smallanthus sonchifolius]|uniref:Uncharacterized protein n=1 Tax=Smallanthus sonchifolius TaxID=185202 RepID=A0ACB9C9E3_9ASTR|nr:hypothetical protein L1987_62049 [Smallanthus sonchifolius]